MFDRMFPYRCKHVGYGWVLKMWVELKCPICGKDLDDDKGMPNFMVCNEESHGVLRFFTGDGCFFTTNEKVAEELGKKGRRVHLVDPKEFFAQHG